MESSGEGGGDDRELYTAEVSAPVEGLNRKEAFHVIKEIIGFVLYMHEQIPSILQHLEIEFDKLIEERKTLEESILTVPELKSCSRRIQSMKIREVKQGLRRLEKLMSALSRLLFSVQTIFDKIDCFYGVSLVLGSSIARPQQVYEVSFSNGRFPSQGPVENGGSKLAEFLSKKVIRTLLSKGAGSSSYKGPMKLFVFVKAPINLDAPQHFLPKRDFKYSKKIIPFRLHIQCKIPAQGMQQFHCLSHVSESIDMPSSSSNDLIWFQCTNTVKGLSGRSTSTVC